MDKELELAQEILENVIANEFSFYVYVTEHGEDGTVSKLLSEKADRILDKLIKTIKKYEQ